MKIRNDYVSNSSSSSFIVLSNKGKYVSKRESINDVVLLPCNDGCMSFEWQTEKYYDMWSKLNWAAIVLLEKIKLEKNESPQLRIKQEIEKPWFRSADMEKLLKAVCSEKLGIEVALNKDAYLSENWKVSIYAGDIDHQSNIRESPENARMFETYDMLYDFIANGNSYIDNSNDNGGRDDKYDPATDSYPARPVDYTI